MQPPYTRTHEIAYCMGLIVGEGCFSGDKWHPMLVVGLHARDPLPLTDFKRVFGGSIYGPFHHRGDQLRWVLAGWQLQEALPYFDMWLPPSHKRVQYEAWKRKWARYFKQLRPIARRARPAPVGVRA